MLNTDYKQLQSPQRFKDHQEGLEFPIVVLFLNFFILTFCKCTKPLPNMTDIYNHQEKSMLQLHSNTEAGIACSHCIHSCPQLLTQFNHLILMLQYMHLQAALQTTALAASRLKLPSFFPGTFAALLISVACLPGWPQQSCTHRWGGWGSRRGSRSDISSAIFIIDTNVLRSRATPRQAKEQISSSDLDVQWRTKPALQAPFNRAGKWTIVQK